MKKVSVFPFLLFLVIGSLFSCSSTDDVQAIEEIEEPVSNPFSVMSFNIRNNANDNDPQPLEARKSLILNVIKDNKPDVVGFQEFSDDWFEQWMEQEMQSLGYRSYNDPIAGRGSPKAIFYKNDRFEVKKEATFEMFFTEGRTGTWIVLNDKTNQQDYFISNSHWTTASSADRVKSANKVISEIKLNYSGLPLVIFGDFNARPGTPEIEALRNASFLTLENVDPEFNETYNGWRAEGISKLDWIFYSTNTLDVVEVEVIKTAYEGYWPSDHWPLMATFKLSDDSKI